MKIPLISRSKHFKNLIEFAHESGILSNVSDFIKCEGLIFTCLIEKVISDNPSLVCSEIAEIRLFHSHSEEIWPIEVMVLITIVFSHNLDSFEEIIRNLKKLWDLINNNNWLCGLFVNFHLLILNYKINI